MIGIAASNPARENHALRRTLTDVPRSESHEAALLAWLASPSYDRTANTIAPDTVHRRDDFNTAADDVFDALDIVFDAVEL